MSLASRVAPHPGASIPAACGGWNETKAAYGFLSNEAIEPQRILDAHRGATMERVAKHATVLAVQDTTYLNQGECPATEGLGPIGEEGTRGMIVHVCLAVSPQGVPLGVLGQYAWARPPQAKRLTEKQRRGTPTAKKESRRWLDMLSASTRGMPRSVRVVVVADREADIFDILARAAELGQEVLIRSCYDRATSDGYAWQEAEGAPVAGTMAVEIARTGGRPARRAILELHYAKVKVKEPDPRAHHRPRPGLALTMLIARERRAPRGVEPVCWRLRTSLPVDSAKAARRCLERYALPWRIERFFYTLKSGCRIEGLQLKTRSRLSRALTVFSVVAWRLLALTCAAREAPDVSSRGFLSADEWRLAHCVVKRTRNPPPGPPTLRDGVRLIARLGGFLARRGDREPGVKVLWRGFARLHDLVLAAEFASTLREGATYG